MRLRRLLINYLLGFLLFAVSFDIGYAQQSAEPDTATADTVSQKYGSVTFEVEPDTAFLYLNNKFDAPIVLTDGKVLELPEGSYRMHIFGREISDRRFTLEVVEDEPQLLRLQYPTSRDGSINNRMYAAYKWGANVMVFSDEGTAISILNTGHESYGTLQAKLPPGSHRIQFRDERGRVQDRYVEVNAYELRTVEQYLKPKRGSSIMRGIVPGASQLYKKQPARAAIAFGAIAATTGLAIHYNQKLGSGTDEFNSVFRDYQNAFNEHDALQLGNQLDQLHQENKSLKRNRNIFRTTAILFYAANIVDAFREPEGGFARSRSFDPFRDFSVGVGEDIVEAKLQIRF